MHGRPATGIMGLGRLYVRGWSRVPSPPAKTTAIMGSELHPALLEEGLEGLVRGLLELLLVVQGLADVAVLAPQEVPRLALLGPVRPLDREDLVPHLHDLRVGLVGLVPRLEVLLVLRVP